jgi:hypothetical protein
MGIVPYKAPAAVSAQQGKFLNQKLYLQPVKNSSHVQLFLIMLFDQNPASYQGGQFA